MDRSACRNFPHLSKRFHTHHSFHPLCSPDSPAPKTSTGETSLAPLQNKSNSASNVKQQTSNIKHQVPNIKHPIRTRRLLLHCHRTNFYNPSIGVDWYSLSVFFRASLDSPPKIRPRHSFIFISSILGKSNTKPNLWTTANMDANCLR